MKCGNCNSDNPDGHKFCGHCGSALTTVCAACGQPLAGGTPDVAEPEPAAELPKSERRQVTVLFADLSNFTALSERLDMGETHALLNRYFETVDSLVESYGGSIDKYIGDRVMAAVGALGCHIGVASGQVVASGTGSAAHREYTITGDSVNLASRL